MNQFSESSIYCELQTFDLSTSFFYKLLLHIETELSYSASYDLVFFAHLLLMSQTLMLLSSELLRMSSCRGWKRQHDTLL